MAKILAFKYHTPSSRIDAPLCLPPAQATGQKGTQSGRMGTARATGPAIAGIKGDMHPNFEH